MSRRMIVIVSGVAALVLAVAVAIVVGLRGDGNGQAITPRTPRASRTPTATPAPTSPFTGLADDRNDPVLAVKIDNVRPARPQTGLDKADIVYIEPVEAGLSRILAVFTSRPPDTVGPVRSARESDLELLRQFGHPALAYSGAQHKLLPVIAAAPVYDVSPAHAGDAYRRDHSRAAPHNLYADPDRLLRHAPKASVARDIGFRFGAAPAGGTADDDHTVRYRAATIRFHWSASKDRWLVSLDGTTAVTARGARLGAPTVVIQYVDVRSSRFKDRWGNVSPYSETVGSGTARVLRDGKAYDARWSRPAAKKGTTFTNATGEPMPFDRGPVWIVLTPRGA